MDYSGLYFIPNQGGSPEASQRILATLTTSLNHTTPDIRTLEPWDLKHRLVRSTPLLSVSTQQQPPPTYQHILRLSYLNQEQAYCYVEKPRPTNQTQLNGATLVPPPSGAVIAIPAAQLDSHLHLLATLLSAQWSYRHSLHLSEGTTYVVGPFTIHMGVLNLSRIANQAPSSPGVVVCITFSVDYDEKSEPTKTTPEEERELTEGAQEQVRAFWNEMRGVNFGTGVQEVMEAKSGLNGWGEQAALVRMWSDVLKLRG